MLDVPGERLELARREDAVAFDPLGRFAHRCRVQFAAAYASFFFTSHEAGAFEDSQVLGDCRSRDAERSRQFADGGISLREAAEDRPPSRVSECAEGTIESPIIGNHVVTNMVNGFFAVKECSSSRGEWMAS